ncbi:THO complex subunit 5-like protein [Auxenochlorella protothecoides]|uniref:THO complex subunit 5-like protein n=1 Tax=Auxenochlorella protothecoides TaxID=3075 RepID=A0A087SHV7_AUXPR|nr:THO complex subunit 5-like protein [Auxenochlorella protothecoides]KFM25311.1 THO complex subunit 5-like protein [Auxenochlorella protothecoides]
MVQAEASPAGLASLFEELISLKTGSQLLGDQPDYAPALRAASEQILRLRALLRERCEHTESLRQDTAAAKVKLDESSLELKNLAYEKEHYTKETNACRAFKSAYADEALELLPVDQFLRVWGDQDVDDPHRLMLNRLTHEMVYRKETIQQLEGLRAKRDALAAEVAGKRGTVSGLESELAGLHAKALALAERYGAAVPPAPGAAAAALASAATLAPPLYVLHSQLLAAARRGEAEASGRHASVEVAAAPGEDGRGGEPIVALRVTSGDAVSLAVDFRYSAELGAVLAAPHPPTTAAQLEAVGGGGAAAAGHAPESGAYAWAQSLAGLDLLPALPPAPASAAWSETELREAIHRYTAANTAPSILASLLEASRQEAMEED